MLYQFVRIRCRSIISQCTFAVTCDNIICLKWMSFKYLNNSFIVMLSFVLWMVADFGNAGNVSSETEHVQQADSWNRFSIILHIFLPMAGLILFFKQKHILSKLLLQLDRNCVSVFCPSFSRREKLLKWAGSRLPETWSSHSQTLSGGVAELWADGSLLCTLINSAIPGACPNPHRHWKKPPLHAQALAYKYLGVVPIFTENELSATLTISLERNFLHYLNELQQAINKQTEKTEGLKSISTYYIPRGMGLYTGEQYRKTVFYVYPNIKNMRNINSNIIVYIKGPYGTYGKAIIPTFHNELFTIPEINVTSDSLATKKLLQKNCKVPKNSFIKGFSLPFMQYHKKHMGDNIVIDITMENDRAKVTYIAKNYGMYEINMISNGELISGCPFSVHILNNTSGIEDNFENDVKEEAIPNIRKRKIISKTIDFIDEKMPMADLLRRYKSNEVKDKKKEDVTNARQVSNNPEFNEVDDDSKNLTQFKHTNKPKTDLFPSNQIERNKNAIIYDEPHLEIPCFKKGMFKLRQNERKIDEEDESNLVFNVGVDINNDNRETVSKTNILNKILDKHFNILEIENSNSITENHSSILHDNAIKSENDEVEVLPKQNSESVIKNSDFNLHDGNNLLTETNIHNNMQGNQSLNVKQYSEYVLEDDESDLQDDNKIMFMTNISNNVHEDDLIILENQNPNNCDIENEKYNLHDGNKIISEISISNNMPNNNYSNILEKHNLESVIENHVSILFDDHKSNFKTNIHNDIFEKDRFNNLEKQNYKFVNEKSNLQTTDENKKKIEYVLNENKQNYVKICKVNDCADKTSTHDIVNKDDLSGNGLAPNKVPIASTLMSENKKLIDLQNKQLRNLDSEDNFHGTKFIINEYQMKFCVNKIQIPEKFCESQSLPNTNLITGLDTKYFKNAINSSNKNELPRRKSAILQEDDVKRVTKTIKSEHPLLETSAVIDNRVNIENDDVNNNNKNIENLEHSEVKRNLVKALSRKNSLADIEKINAVPRRFFKTQEPPNKNSKPDSPHQNKQTVTSPICPDHIDPEVENEYRQMSVAERRKIFATQSTDNISHSTNSSFSEPENDGGSKIPRHFRQFEGLSVLNYLGSLKQSQNPRTSENYSLCSTISLPNINSVESELIFENSVKARKNFWEKMSSSSSSLSTNESSPKRKPKKLSEHERCRLIWKKPNEETLNTNVGSAEIHSWRKMPDIYKSADDILSITNCIPYQSPKKYKSLDNSLDNCTMLSIDERKKKLLKQNYDKEKIETDKLSSLKKSNIMKSYGKNMNKISEESYGKNMNKICEPRNDDTRSDTFVFSPILDKIKKYDSALNLTSNTKVEKVNVSTNTKNSKSSNDISDSYIHNDLQSLPQPQKMTIKSHFKRAISYFKNLEEKSLGKTKSKPVKKDCRSYSLDIQSNRNKNVRRGGSLNLPNVSERFSINNLYSDVFGNKRGSFKGAANQSALVEALATFSRKENHINEEDEDDIKYNIFKRKAKSKKRRSVRSIFDVYY